MSTPWADKTAKYKQLCAILDTTKDRHNPLHAEIRGHHTYLYLCIVQMTRKPDGRMSRKTLAKAPFNVDNPDAAADLVARKLTLDGSLPTGM